MHQLRRNIGHHADNALAAQCQQGNHLIVIAGVDIQRITAQCSHLGHLRDVAGGLLDAVDERVLAQLQSGLGCNVQTRAGGHIVQDDRDAASLSHGGKVRHQTGLRGLVVVGGDHQQGIGTAGGRLCCQCAAVVGIVRTGTGNDRYAVIDRIHGKLDGGQLLLIGHGRALAGGAADDDGISVAGDLILDNAAQLVKVDASVLVHRGDDGNTRTGKDRLLHSKNSFAACIAQKFRH